MFGANDPKKIEKMMKKLNMNVQQIDAEKVVIKAKDKDIVIAQPEVMLMNVMGRDVYQITGSSVEKKQLKEEDVKMVMEQTGRDRQTVEKKIEELNNDLARAIIELKEAEGK